MKGAAHVSVRRADDNRHIADCFQRSPLRVFLPYSYASNCMEIVLANTAGGVVAGDELNVTVWTKEMAAVIVTSQAAEKVYRSEGMDAKIAVSLAAGSGTRLHWIPQETILFDGVRLRRRMVIDVERGASVLAGEMQVLGRTASGEQLTHGLFHDEWRVRYAGELMWADNLHLAGNVRKQLHSTVGFDGGNAMASLVYVAEDNAAHMDCARSLLGDAQCRTGVTLVGKVMIARWLGKDPAVLRQSYTDFVVAFISEVSAEPFSLPQVWRV